MQKQHTKKSYTFRPLCAKVEHFTYILCFGNVVLSKLHLNCTRPSRYKLLAENLTMFAPVTFNTLDGKERARALALASHKEV